jgi:hypothetical protein
MKKGTTFALLASVLLCGALFVTACNTSSSSTEPTANDPALIGTWLLQAGRGPLPVGTTLAFTATDWVMTLVRTCSMSGTYTAANGTLTIEVKEDNGCGQRPGSRQRMSYAVGGRNLTLDDEDGTRTEWIRQ